jgi:hypothetical protein
MLDQNNLEKKAITEFKCAQISRRGFSQPRRVSVIPDFVIDMTLAYHLMYDQWILVFHWIKHQIVS